VWVKVFQEPTFTPVKTAEGMISPKKSTAVTATRTAAHDGTRVSRTTGTREECMMIEVVKREIQREFSAAG
jgi:hypothetical protein